jgi:activator of HSP90 ATPase
VGGAFTLFGGYITGRHVELVPNDRIVQAWRTGGWAPGVYSIAKFELVEQGSLQKSRTRILLPRPFAGSLPALSGLAS